MSEEPIIRLVNVSKDYDGTEALKNINLYIRKNEFLTLLGPSGCGKTTTLRMINRLIEPSSGNVFINDIDINKIDPVELRRNIGYVIQQIGLFPHMNIAQNIGLVPQLKNIAKTELKRRVEELLELVDMPPSEFYYRYPNELSGGQQQRIGVARALAADPDIILMDEPFGALDPITRSTLQDEFLGMQDKLGKTIVFVTHDMNEALKLADKIAIMKNGEILQFDSPETILTKAKNGFVEEFIGKDRLLRRPEFINVRDIMIKNPIKILPERTLTYALEKMRQENVDSLMIIDRGGKLMGLVTAKDILDNFDKLEKVLNLTKTSIHYVLEDANASQVLSIMAQEGVGYVPVINNDKKLIGLVTRSRLVNVLGKV